jgi:hypothetical protein
MEPMMDPVRAYYRAQVIIAMRAAGHSLREIAGYFWISHQRVAQITRRGPIAAQLPIAFSRAATDVDA